MANRSYRVTIRAGDTYWSRDIEAGGDVVLIPADAALDFLRTAASRGQRLDQLDGLHVTIMPITAAAGMAALPDGVVANKTDHWLATQAPPGQPIEPEQQFIAPQTAAELRPVKGK